MTHEYCQYGEFPPLASTDFLMPAPGVVDAPLPARSDAGGCSPTVVEALQALDSILAENAELRAKLASATQARDTAQAQLAHYSRKGW